MPYHDVYDADLRVLVFLLANVLDGFALLLKAGVRREDVSRVELQSERVFPNITQPWSA